jgi:hypothetical protein
LKGQGLRQACCAWETLANRLYRPYELVHRVRYHRLPNRFKGNALHHFIRQKPKPDANKANQERGLKEKALLGGGKARKPLQVRHTGPRTPFDSASISSQTKGKKQPLLGDDSLLQGGDLDNLTDAAKPSMLGCDKSNELSANTTDVASFDRPQLSLINLAW